MIIFLRKYKSKIALMVFVCVLVCTVSCLLDFKTLEKQKMPGLEKKSVFMAAENTVAKNTDKAVNEPRLHAVSAALIMRCLMKSEGCIRVEWTKLRIHWKMLGKIAQIGLPAGVQGVLFSISNVLIQSSVNSFGSVAMAGNTAAQNVEGFVYTSMNSVHQTAVSFTSQNLGGRQYGRINKILAECILFVTAVGLILGNGAYLLGNQILGIYSSDPEVIAYGLERLSIICTMYCLCGIMDVLVGSIRGLGYAVMPMIVSLMGVCVFRVVYIYTIFQWSRTLQTLYISYPITWTLTAAVHVICFVIVRRKIGMQK